jgi:hypothetical protein
MMNAPQQAHVVKALYTLLTRTFYGGQEGARFTEVRLVDAGPLGLAISARVEVGSQAWDDDAAPRIAILVVPEPAAPAA